jgi:hypothetical protein
MYWFMKDKFADEITKILTSEVSLLDSLGDMEYVEDGCLVARIEPPVDDLFDQIKQLVAQALRRAGSDVKFLVTGRVFRIDDKRNLILKFKKVTN